MNVLKSIFSKEAALALVFGLVTNNFIDQRHAIKGQQQQPQLVDPNDVFTSQELTTLTTVWEDNNGPEGKFLKGRHGVTHYIVDRGNNNNESKKGIIILCHGLGQSLKMYKEFSDILVKDGFAVLRYDYFGHGYSKYVGRDIWVKYTPDVFVNQLEDLIDFVTKEENEEVVAFVGHSNGGVVGISANYRWNSDSTNKRKLIPKLILANPAIYASKPLLAKIADKIPTVMTTLFKVIPPARVLVADNYMDTITKAFGKNDNGDYIFPEAFQAAMDSNNRLFGKVKGIDKHPFLDAAILGISSYNIPTERLPTYVDQLEKLSKRDSSTEEKIHFVWGKKDVVVPYKENVEEIEKLASSSDIMTLDVLEGISHECFLENTRAFAKLVLPTLNA